MEMNPSVIVRLTIPMGRDAVIGTLHRVYGPHRLERPMEGYVIAKEQYWAKNPQNAWTLTDRRRVLTVDPDGRIYGLNCFILRA